MITDQQAIDKANNWRKQAAEMAEENGLSEEINLAYIELVGEDYATADDAQEAYCGDYSSNEDFAREQADSLGLINDRVQWPYTCIDWEWAARELMMDYSEIDGHYFRNL